MESTLCWGGLDIYAVRRTVYVKVDRERGMQCEVQCQCASAQRRSMPSDDEASNIMEWWVAGYAARPHTLVWASRAPLIQPAGPSRLSRRLGPRELGDCPRPGAEDEVRRRAVCAMCSHAARKEAPVRATWSDLGHKAVCPSRCIRVSFGSAPPHWDGCIHRSRLQTADQCTFSRHCGRSD